MNLLDPNCGLDPEERREILLHTDAGRAVIAAEDAEMSRAVHFAEGLPPGWSVGAYVKGPKKGSPCLIKGVRGQPGGVQVKPIPEGYEPDHQGGLRRKESGTAATIGPASTPSEQPRQPTTIALDDGSRRMAEAAKRDIERLVARASSSPAQANLIRVNVHNRVRTLSRPEMEDVAAHLGIVAAHGGKFPNKRAVLHAIVDHVASLAIQPPTPRREEGGSTTPASHAATPSESPHPLAALPTRSDKFNRLVAMASQEQEHLRGSHNRFTDPLGVFTKGPPPGLNAGAFMDDLIGTAARHHFNTSTEAPLQELYDTVGMKHGLSKHGFLRAVGDIYNRHGRSRSPFFLDRYSGNPGGLQASGHDPELLMITPTGGINNSLRLDQSEVPGEMRRQGLRGDQTLETPHSRQRLAESGRSVPPEQPPVAQRPAPPPAPPTSSAAPARANPGNSADRVSGRVEVARAEIGRLNASALSVYTTPGRVEAVVRGYASYLTRTEMDQVAAHIGVVRKLPNKEAVVKAIIDRIVSQKGAYARGLE